ncbi:CIA30 family protein [Flavobacterium sp.]|uniref:CIA30 family protein n=1 Tax=Flavobacterium sp. TaxID=239 RepID=UPI0038FCCB4C
MKLFITLSMLLLIQSQLIFDFNHNSNITDWNIVDDVVMGGRSNGKFKIDNDGNGVFSGDVSLENNGGFSSVRYQFEKINTTKDSKVIIRLKGDGKEYQFRIKNNRNTYYSYITSFKTSGNWETIVFNLKDLYPSFRGQTMNIPNFTGNSIEEIVFLIGNKKNESFTLVLDKIDIE